MGMPPATEASKASAAWCVFGQPRQLQAVLGEQRLVGGDDRFARAQRGLDAFARRALVAADQFDEQVDVFGTRQLEGVLEPFDAGEIEPGRGRVAGGDAGDGDLRGRCGRRDRRLALRRPTTAAPTVPRPAMPTRKTSPWSGPRRKLECGAFCLILAGGSMRTRAPSEGGVRALIKK